MITIMHHVIVFGSQCWVAHESGHCVRELNTGEYVCTQVHGRDGDVSDMIRTRKGLEMNLC